MTPSSAFSGGDSAARNLDRLYMTVQAMWELLSERTGLTKAELDAKIREIDLRDGKLDGRDATQSASCKCAKCGRPVLPGHMRCIWCGTALGGDSFSHR